MPNWITFDGGNSRTFPADLQAVEFETTTDNEIHLGFFRSEEIETLGFDAELDGLSSYVCRVCVFCCECGTHWDDVSRWRAKLDD